MLQLCLFPFLARRLSHSRSLFFAHCKSRTTHFSGVCVCVCGMRTTMSIAYSVFAVRISYARLFAKMKSNERHGYAAIGEHRQTTTDWKHIVCSIPFGNISYILNTHSLTQSKQSHSRTQKTHILCYAIRISYWWVGIPEDEYLLLLLPSPSGRCRAAGGP